MAHFFATAEDLLPVLLSVEAQHSIKYTPTASTGSPQGGFVKVEVRAEGSQEQGTGNKEFRVARVSVSDSGLGVPADLIPHLFEEFIRDERVKKEIRGTGLGLYIARKIAEAHGGKMRAESAGEGKGSTFSVTVPLAQ